MRNQARSRAIADIHPQRARKVLLSFALGFGVFVIAAQLIVRFLG